MPKNYNHVGRNRKAIARRVYVPQEKRIATLRRPLASKYGDELYFKVQRVQPLATDAAGNVFAYMRADGTTSTATNI